MVVAMAKASDPRFDRTEADLMEAFQRLTRKKDPERITVQEITRVAGVTRTTFYNHYVDMPSLLSAAEKRILDEIFTMMRSFHPQSSEEICRSFFDTLCRYTRDNAFLTRVLVSPHATVFVEHALSMFQHYVRSTLEESGRQGAEQQALSYAIAYAIGGVVGVLHRWAVTGCKEEPAEVSRLLAAPFLDGMRPFLHG